MDERVFVGIDPSGGFHEVQLTDVGGKRVGRSFRIGRGLRAVQELIDGVGDRVGDAERAVFTVEATQNLWMELVHPLVRRGHTVYLVSPSKSTDLRRFLHKHTKTDPTDAEAISRVPAVDAKLSAAVVGDRRYDTLRRLARQSWQLRERMSARKRRVMNRVQTVYPGYEKVFRNRYCGASLLFMRRYLNPSRARRLGRRRLGALLCKRAWGKFPAARQDLLWSVIENAPELEIDYTDFQFLVNQDLDLLEAEEHSQQAIRDRMAEIYSEIEPTSLLLSVQGVGDFIAATITAFLGEPGRFRSSNQAVAFAGLCPRKKSTAGVDTPNQGLTQAGDPTLRSVLYVAAEIARHYDPELQAFYRRLRKRGKHHKLVVNALAAKLLRRCFALLRTQRTYEIAHQARLAQLKEEGRTVRTSVSEVAELLNDGGDRSIPAGAYPHLRGRSTRQKRAYRGVT